MSGCACRQPWQKGKAYLLKNTDQKIALKRDDVIEFEEHGESIIVSIVNRQKVSGGYYNYFKVKGEDELMRNINFERMRYRKLEAEEYNRSRQKRGI